MEHRPAFVAGLVFQSTCDVVAISHHPGSVIDHYRGHGGKSMDGDEHTNW